MGGFKVELSTRMTPIEVMRLADRELTRAGVDSVLAETRGQLDPPHVDTRLWVRQPVQIYEAEIRVRGKRTLRGEPGTCAVLVAAFEPRPGHAGTDVVIMCDGLLSARKLFGDRAARRVETALRESG